MFELEGFDFSESVYDDKIELNSINNDYNYSKNVSERIDGWLRQMPRW